MNSLRFEPLVPGALWMALAVVGAALLLFYALRRRPSGVTRWRWGGIVGLMGLAVGLVLGVLLNPTWVREIPPPAGKPLLTVLVDASGSMATPDADGQARYDAAVRSAGGIIDDLSRRFDVRVRRFAESGAVDSDMDELPTTRPTGTATDLAGGIAGTLNEDRPQGQAVVVLSDGIHNAPGGSGAQRVLEAARAARAVGAPLYTRTFGAAGEGAGFDLRVEMRASQDLAFVGQRLGVTARVLAPGLSGGRANVVLLHDGVEVGREAVDLSPERAAEARFWVSRDATGVFAYEARVEPLPGELTQANNAAPYLLRVVDQPVRVLQLEGKPYWDSKFLMRTLAAVPAVEIDSVVRVAEGRYLRRTLKRGEAGKESGVGNQESGVAANVDVVAAAAGTTTAPAGTDTAKVHDWKIVSDPAEVLGDTDALKSYQVIVLGRDAEQFLTGAAMDRLQEWVAREGGSLVCYRGSPTVQAHERLARLLPVRWTPSHEARFRMKLTPDGQNLQWFGGAGPGGAAPGTPSSSPDAPQAVLASLPTLASRAQVDRAKPLAVVLATAVSQDGGSGAALASGAPAEQPAVVYQPYGTGRVVVVEGSGMWRWAFLPPKFRGQEEVYASLWHSMLRWLISAENLMPGQRLSLRADKVSFDSTEPATATLLVRDEAAGKGKPPMVELVSGGSADGAGGEVKSFAAAPLGEEPGTFRVNFGKLPEGRYVLRVAGAPPEEAYARTVFGVRTIGEEQLNLKPRPDLMARLAADSGGKVLESGDGREIDEAFRAHIAALRPPRFERATAWDRWWVLVAVIGLWGLSWALRRSAGLV